MRGEDLADEFLGGRLPVGAGQADDGNSQLLPMEGRQLLQCLERVREADQAGVVSLGIIIHDGVGSAGLEGLDGIGVAVERLALEGDENLTRLQGTGIGVHAFGGAEQFV